MSMEVKKCRQRDRMALSNKVVISTDGEEVYHRRICDCKKTDIPAFWRYEEEHNKNRK